MKDPLLIRQENDEYLQLKPPEGRKYMKNSNFLFSNITPLINLINENDAQIENSILSCFLQEELDPKLCVNTVLKILHKRKQSEAQNTTPTLFIFRSLFLKQFIICGVFNFFQKIILTIMIIILDQVTEALKEYGTTKQNKHIPILYLGFMLIVYFLNSYVDAKYKNMLNILMNKIKIATQFLIYQKALKTKFVAEGAEKIKKNGDKKKEGHENKTANIFNLMTVDVDQVLLIEYGVYELIGNLFIVFGAFYFLYMRLGDVVLTGIYISVFSTSYNLLVSFGEILFIQRALQWKDQRVELTSDVVQGIKQIKYLSWEKIFSDKILVLRKKEFIMIAITKVLDGMSAIYWNSISYILMYYFLVQFVNEGHSLASTNVFTLITVFNLITFPLGVIPWTFNNILLSTISYRRIKKYLDQNEIVTLNTHNMNFNTYKDLTIHDPVVSIKNMSFIWPPNVKEASKNKSQSEQPENFQFKLNVENFEVKKNSLNIIIGKIGCGKSALFNAILNELDVDYSKNNYQSVNASLSFTGVSMATMNESQQFEVLGDLAYVAQTSWLQNETIRNNILFGKIYEPEFYKQCIDACELAYDLNTFDYKDLQELGPEGKNISGGQKQRIALCRALYQDKDIYLLDDVFSSLDIHIADAIYEKVIKNLLLKRGKTVIMITSHFRILKIGHIQVENIYLLDNGNFINDSKLIEQFITIETLKEHEGGNKQERMKSLSLEGYEEQNIILARNLSAHNRLLNSAINVDQGRELDEELREQGELNNSTITTYFASMTWILFTLLILSNFIMQFSRNLIDFWLRSQVTDGDETFYFFEVWFGDFESIFTMLLIFQLSITTIRCTSYVLCNLISAWRLFKKLNSSVIMSQMKFFDTNNEGRIINRISNDTYEIDTELPWFAHIFLDNLAESVGYPIGIIILFPWISIILMAELYIIYILQRKFRKANRDLKRINSANEGKLIGFLSETLSGIKTIRAFVKSLTFLVDYTQKMTLTVVSKSSGNICLFWLSIRLMLLSNCIFVAVALTIIVFISFDIDVQYTTCALTLTYSVMMFNSFTEAIKYFSAVEQRIVSVERVKQYFNNPLEDIESKFQVIERQNLDQIEQQLGPIQQQLAHKDLSDYAVVFDNVCLTYEDTSNPNPKYALRKFSLSIRRSEKIAFVGRTGSGKTSILNVLFRLYDFQYGSIYVNGKDTDKISLKETRQQMSVVPQFGFLYKASIKDNLDPLGILNPEKIQELFTRTGFSIKGSSTDKGVDLNFMISQSGSNLSNGEKQVINFFRTILQDRDIVCLDEATSNMDPQTDTDLHKLLFKFTRDRTLLVVTHRLENIRMFDRIVVMDQGEIVEIGNFHELSNKKNGFFNKLLSTK